MLAIKVNPVKLFFILNLQLNRNSTWVESVKDSNEKNVCNESDGQKNYLFKHTVQTLWSQLKWLITKLDIFHSQKIKFSNESSDIMRD